MNGNFKIYDSIGLKVKSRYFVVAMCFESKPKSRRLQTSCLYLVVGKCRSRYYNFVTRFTGLTDSQQVAPINKISSGPNNFFSRQQFAVVLVTKPCIYNWGCKTKGENNCLLSMSLI